MLGPGQYSLGISRGGHIKEGELEVGGHARRLLGIVLWHWGWAVVTATHGTYGELWVWGIGHEVCETMMRMGVGRIETHEKLWVWGMGQEVCGTMARMGVGRFKT